MTDRVLEKHRLFINNRGGIFTSKMRSRLLELSPGRPGWSESSADFRYDVREYTKQALRDLELFIKVVDKKDLNMVLNLEYLEPIAEALFWHPVREKKDPDPVRATIAHKFISMGFAYLTMKLRVRMRIISEALEISHILLDTFKGD